MSLAYFIQRPCSLVAHTFLFLLKWKVEETDLYSLLPLYESYESADKLAVDFLECIILSLVFVNYTEFYMMC